MVEFYDSRYYPQVHAPYGQFVARYYITTILSRDKQGYFTDPEGFILDGGVPAWQVSAEDMQQVITFLKEHQA